MVLKRLMGLFFAGALAFSAMASDIVIRLAPPRAVIERRSPRPSRNHVWVSGYQRWDGNAYSLNQGRHMIVVSSFLLYRRRWRRACHLRVHPRIRSPPTLQASAHRHYLNPIDWRVCGMPPQVPPCLLDWP